MVDVQVPVELGVVVVRGRRAGVIDVQVRVELGVVIVQLHVELGVLKLCAEPSLCFRLGCYWD